MFLSLAPGSQVRGKSALHGEYLKAAAAAESALADAIARRAGILVGELESLVLAAAAIAAERAAVLHWARTMAPRSSLADTVRTAVGMAVRCLAGPGSTLD